MRYSIMKHFLPKVIQKDLRPLILSHGGRIKLPTLGGCNVHSGLDISDLQKRSSGKVIVRGTHKQEAQKPIMIRYLLSSVEVHGDNNAALCQPPGTRPRSYSRAESVARFYAFGNWVNGVMMYADVRILSKENSCDSVSEWKPDRMDIPDLGIRYQVKKGKIIVMVRNGEEVREREVDLKEIQHQTVFHASLQQAQDADLAPGTIVIEPPKGTKSDRKLITYHVVGSSYYGESGVQVFLWSKYTIKIDPLDVVKLETPESREHMVINDLANRELIAYGKPKTPKQRTLMNNAVIRWVYANGMLPVDVTSSAQVTGGAGAGLVLMWERERAITRSLPPACVIGNQHTIFGVALTLPFIFNELYVDPNLFHGKAYFSYVTLLRNYAQNYQELIEAEWPENEYYPKLSIERYDELIKISLEFYEKVNKLLLPIKTSHFSVYHEDPPLGYNLEKVEEALRASFAPFINSELEETLQQRSDLR